MKNLILIITIVFSGMLGQAQKSIGYNEQLVYVNEDSYMLRDIIDTLNMNDKVYVLKTTDSKHQVMYTNSENDTITGWIAHFSLTKPDAPSKLDWSIDKNYKGELISRYSESGYVSETYLRGSTYYNYVNGKLESTYTVNY